MALGDALFISVYDYNERKRKKKIPWLYSNAGMPQGSGAIITPWRMRGWTRRTLRGLRIGTWFGLVEWRRRAAPDATADTHAEHDRLEEQRIYHYLIICSVSGGLAAAGLIIPPLKFLSVPGLLYVAAPTLRDAYRELYQERKASMAMVYSLLILGTMGLGRFVASAMTVGLRLLGQKLLMRTERTSKQTLLNILGEQPRTIWVQQANMELEIPFDALRLGDVVITQAGETVPVDGTIVFGLASIDQHVLTGESQPVERGPGDEVYAATVMLSGKIGLVVEKAGQDTVAAQIGEVLSRTADFSSAVQLRAQAIGDQSAPYVLALSALTLPVLGPVSAVSLLTASFGYDLRITAPTSALNFLRLASRQGLLIKDGRALEILQQVDTVVFDKTGTLTLEQPHVGAIITCGDITEDQLLIYAAAAEHRQTHPIARAILDEASRRGTPILEIEDAAYDVGYGIKVRVADRTIRVGSARYMALEEIAIPPVIQDHQVMGHAQGYALVYVAVDGELGGAMALHATTRPEARRMIRALRRRDVSIYVISGDQEAPTRKLADELGVDHYIAETLPEHKAEVIERLQRDGKTVCFVGDGINDAIALKQANVSISLRGAAGVATDTAQIILLDQNLQQVDRLFDLAASLKANMRNNVVITVISSALTVGAVYIWQVGVVGSLVIYNLGLASGVINATLPLLRHREEGQPCGALNCRR